MKYSRNKINTAGKSLLAGPEIGFAFTDANLVVDDWRKLHMIPLEELVGVVTRTLSQAGVSAAFSSYRLKRINPVCRKKGSVEAYPSGKLEDATRYYSEVEKSINDENSAVVLVSVSDMKELQEAYPSYFLNASEFVQSLQDFNNTCKAKHYI